MTTVPGYLQDFGAYEKEVASIYDTLQQASDPIELAEGLPTYLGQGADFCVFRSQDNPNAVIKLPITESAAYPEEVIETHAQAHILGRQILGLEQMLTYSPLRLRSVICKYVPGQELYDLPEGLFQNIPTGHLADLLDTYEAMQDRGLATDEPINTLYDSRTGLTIIDYKYDPTQTLQDKIVEFSGDIGLIWNKTGGVTLTPAALAFKGLCGERFGRAMAVAIEEAWPVMFKSYAPKGTA